MSKGHTWQRMRAVGSGALSIFIDSGLVEHNCASHREEDHPCRPQSCKYSEYMAGGHRTVDLMLEELLSLSIAALSEAAG